jgi:hypothetical protein
MTDKNKPQRGLAFSHLPDELYAALSALKEAYIDPPDPEPQEGWNDALTELFVLAAKSSSKKPLSRKTMAKATANLESGLKAAFVERGAELDPVAFQVWEDAGAALGRAGAIAGPVG